MKDQYRWLNKPRAEQLPDSGFLANAVLGGLAIGTGLLATLPLWSGWLAEVVR